MYFNNILEAVGHTPLIKLNKVIRGIKATVLVKAEFFNPGNSIKDRIAIKMIEDAEKEGLLKPGGTIIEGTSGNTGLGLALVGIIKGYKCIFVTNDKQSKEKIDIMKAHGAEVVVCPTSVAADDPRSYYSVAKKMSETLPNAFYANQYYNLSNLQAHYETTGPEIWEQTEGKITHLLAGVGTGGTISGVGKYLKEQKPAIKVWGIDTYGSVLKKYHETKKFHQSEIYPYITEGIGEDIIPDNIDFDIIDHFEKVTDKDGAVMARELVRKEGIFAGYSAGSAIAGLLQMKDQLKEGDLVVVILPDHGSRYVAKVYNDEWMREWGFLEYATLKAEDIISSKENKGVVTLKKSDSVQQATQIMQEMQISQIPVLDDKGEVVGTVTENNLYFNLLQNPELKNDQVESIMGKPFKVIDDMASYEEISKIIDRQTPAVLVKQTNGKLEIITKSDIIQALAK